MTEHEKYQEHIRHTHDAFCKTVIRHAAIDAARSIRSRRKREISLEYLIEEKHYPFSTTDKYFAEQSGMTSYPLFVCGQMVLLESPELAAALSALSQMEQEIIFLYYFQRLTHREIGRRYGRAGNTTGRRTTSGWAPRPSPPTGSCCGRPLTGPWSAGRRTWRPF